MDSKNLRIKQFLFASFNRIGYRLVKSKDLDKLISEGSIIHLCRQAGKHDQQTFIHAFLPDEKLLTISCITPGTDIGGRPNSHNRTFIINTRDLEELLKPYLMEPIPLTVPRDMSDVTVKLEFQ